MLLAVDVGNTKIKAAVFKHTDLLERYVFGKNEADTAIETIFASHPDIANAVLSSVGNDNPGLLSYIKKHCPLLMVISHQSHFPYHNNYATPATLGIDRMVLAAGAVLQYPGRNRLVIDAGTCITYDFITSDDSYAGGAISPGLRLRYEALHNFTAKLPLLTADGPEGYIGNSTVQSIHSGVVNGALYEIEGFIGEYRRRYQDIQIILTGGDADFLARRFKNTIFANSNFLLESLNNLYLYIQTRND